MKKGATNSKESNVDVMGGYVGRRGREEIKQLYYSLRN